MEFTGKLSWQENSLPSLIPLFASIVLVFRFFFLKLWISQEQTPDYDLVAKKPPKKTVNNH